VLWMLPMKVPMGDESQQLQIEPMQRTSL